MNTAGHLMINLLVCLATLHSTYGGAVTWTTPTGAATGATHTANLQEDVSPGDAVTSVVAATDASGGSIATYAIDSQTPGAKFTIATATSGAITVAAGESFDRETTSSYTVNVVATDDDTTPGSSTIAITVTITDVVEANPAYAAATQTNQVCSTATSGTIGTYTITGHASRLTWNAIAYAIRSGDDAGGNAKFGIASGTGDLIKTSQAFDVATKSEYVLIIDAVSAGAAAATASTTLTVTAVASACSSASVISGSLVAMATVLLSAIINRLL